MTCLHLKRILNLTFFVLRKETVVGAMTDWGRLRKESHRTLWMNPPFTKIHQVLTKVAMEKVQALIVTPNWKSAEWGPLLDRLTVARSRPISKTNHQFIYKNEMGQHIPSPKWETFISLIDGERNSIRTDELDKKMMGFVKKTYRGKGFSDLEDRMKMFQPTNVLRTKPVNYVETEVLQSPKFENPTGENDISSIEVEDETTEFNQDLFVCLLEDLKICPIELNGENASTEEPMDTTVGFSFQALS